MDEASTSRLIGISGAFDHAATAWLLAAAAVSLALAPAFIAVLTRRLPVESRRAVWTKYRSWLVIAPLVVLPIMLGAAWAIAGVCVLSLLCYREYARATGLFRETLESAAVVAGILALTFATLDHWPALFTSVASITVVAIATVGLVPDRPKGYVQRVALGIFGFMLLGSCLGHLGLLANDAAYRPIMLAVLVCTQLGDTFAFACGSVMKSVPLAPNTSPAKTVAGSVGGVVLTVPVTALAVHLVFEGTALADPTHAIALGLIIALGGQLGDLLMTSIKRDIGIREMGVTIPGHGGLLDRFDSLLLVSPAVYHYIAYVRGVGVDQPQRIFSGLLG